MELLYFQKWNFLAPRLKNFMCEPSELKKKKKLTLEKIILFSFYFRRLFKKNCISGGNLQSPNNKRKMHSEETSNIFPKKGSSQISGWLLNKP